MYDPNGVAVDQEGNIFISQRNIRYIYRVDADTGIITIPIGNTLQGFSGDGGVAYYARLISPSGLAVDNMGNLLLAGGASHRIRKVTSFSNMASFTLDDANQNDGDSVEQSITFNDLPVGTYEITETLPDNWQLDSASCVGASGPVSLVEKTLLVAVGTGENIVCTFNNSARNELASITITKTAKPSITDEQFSFTSDLGDFSLNADSSQSFDVLPGTYKVIEIDLPELWTLLTMW